MSKQDDDFDKLMAETERMLGGTPARSAPAPRPEPAAPQKTGTFEHVVRTSAYSGGIAALLVFVGFAMTPFLGAVSGAAGAFLATFVIMAVQRITGGRKR